MSRSKAFPTLPVSLKIFLNNARKWKDALVQMLLQGWQLPGHTMTTFTIRVFGDDVKQQWDLT
jgi:hypothetical protein